MPIYALGSLVPSIDAAAFVHPDATVIGDVKIGPGSTIWAQTVVRGDDNSITIGARTSVQDGAVLHCTAFLTTVVGNECVIGHLAHLEGCVVHDRALVGVGAIVLHEAVIETGALVGAGAVVRNNMVVPSRAMALGVPAKIRADCVDPDEIDRIVHEYAAKVDRYRADLRRVS